MRSGPVSSLVSGGPLGGASVIGEIVMRQLPGRGSAQRDASITTTGAAVRGKAWDTISATGLVAVWALLVLVVVLLLWKRR